MIDPRETPLSQAGLRCALCHAAIGQADARRCANCGTVLHGECSSHLWGCPTIGCAAGFRAAVKPAPTKATEQPAPIKARSPENWGWLVMSGLASLASAALLGASAGYWTLMDALTPFLAPLLFLAIFFVFAGVGFCSLIYCLLRLRRHRRACIPLAIQVLALILQSTVNWTQLWLDADFWWKRDARMALIRQIERGDISDSLITGRPDLSQSGDIWVDRRGAKVTVFFYTYRGVLDSYAGYVYCSEPNGTPDPPAGLYRHWKRVDEHWSWTTAY